MKKYTYDITQFKYDRNTNTLFARANSIYVQMEDGNPHHDPFPNGRKQFYIKNYKTNNERRFRFVEEERDYQEQYDEEGNIYAVAFDPIKTWVFESEEGIKCKVRMD